ncbi:hypothetical protein B566_EDAN002513 [Ephemera danica]|nr:hypothetical protein B566_EDAN002513 [Ephemera danica]
MIEVVNMAHLIPPMMSTTPPPLGDTQEEEEDDDFGDFATADYSFQNDESESPQHTPHEKIQWPTDDIHTSTEEKSISCETTARVNGMQPLECHEGTDEEIEEELKQCTTDAITSSLPDNTSQDSVVSTNTDSGLCSASEEASPLPPPSDSPPEPSLQTLVSSGSDETITVEWTPQPPDTVHNLESSSSSLPSISMSSYLPDSSSLTINDVLCDSTVPDTKNDLQSQNNCDLVSTHSDEFGDFETAFSRSNESFVHEHMLYNSDISSTVKLNFSTSEDEGVPLPTVSSNDRQRVTNEISLAEHQSKNIKAVESDSQIKSLDELKGSDEAVSLNGYNIISSSVDDASNLLNQLDTHQQKNSFKSEPCVVSTDIGDFLENSNSEVDNQSKHSDVTAAMESNDVNTLSSTCEELPISSQVEDDFSDFKFVPPSETNNEVDDFGDFEVAPTLTESLQPTSSDGFGDFADFSSAPQASNDDDAWAQSFSETSLPIQPSSGNGDDEFDDFESALTSDTSMSFQHSSNEDVGELVAQLFASPEEEEQLDDVIAIQPAHLSSWLSPEVGQSGKSPIWVSLKDMFGQRWNSSMPRFAANLGNSPLEPMKADMTSGGAPTVSKPVGAGVSLQNSGVPQEQVVKANTSHITAQVNQVAKSIIASLPDISFMKAVHLVHKKS